MKPVAVAPNNSFKREAASRLPLIQVLGGSGRFMQLQIANWQIECNPEATRAAYAPLPIGTNCSCDQCRNFNAAADQTFPLEFIALADSMGIDPSKPAELCHWSRESSGLYLTGGWFHFVGRIVSGGDAMQHPDGTGSIQYQFLAPGIEVGLTRHTGLVPGTFAELAVCQLEFQTHVPWVLADAEPAP